MILHCGKKLVVIIFDGIGKKINELNFDGMRLFNAILSILHWQYWTNHQHSIPAVQQSIAVSWLGHFWLYVQWDFSMCKHKRKRQYGQARLCKPAMWWVFPAICSNLRSHQVFIFISMKNFKEYIFKAGVKATWTAKSIDFLLYRIFR